MSDTLNEVVVHVNEDMDDATLRDVEEGIRLESGVVSVGCRPDRRHLLVVVYDSGAVRAAGILHNIQARGLHAQLIGM